VSKRLSAPYRLGPSRDWLKVKNPESPAMIRARERSGEFMTIDAAQGAVQLVIANALVENGEISGLEFDALFAM
jgi:ATP-dependent DNA ligase